MPILEKGLAELLAEGLSSRRLRFVVGAATAARGAEIVFLCVQTPQGADGAADLSFVETVAREIAPVLAPRDRRGEQVDSARGVDPFRRTRAFGGRRRPRRRECGVES